MSIPYGKLKKSPQQNTACFVGCLIAYIDKAKGKETSSKALKKYDKYMNRMLEIVGGKSKKCPATYDNLLKISSELGKEAEYVAKIFINLDVFISEDRKNIIDIFGEIMKIDVEPNPICNGLAQDGNNLIDQILSKLDAPGMSIHYGNILKVMTNQPELINCFLRYDVFKTLSTLV